LFTSDKRCAICKLQAGLDGKRLTIALEPEAASYFCMHLPVTKMDITSFAAAPRAQVSAFPIGTKYMVVDAGGIVR